MPTIIEIPSQQDAKAAKAGNKSGQSVASNENEFNSSLFTSIKSPLIITSAPHCPKAFKILYQPVKNLDSTHEF